MVGTERHGGLDAPWWWNSRHAVVVWTQSNCVKASRSVGAVGLEQSLIRARRRPLDVDAISRLSLGARTWRALARAATRTSQPAEALQVLWIDGPDRSDLDAEEPLRDQQAANVGFRGAQGGGSFDDGKRSWAIDAQILARSRNNLSQKLLWCDDLDRGGRRKRWPGRPR